MALQSSLSDGDKVVVMDTSVVINLNATGCAEAILKALPFRAVVVDLAAHELQNCHANARRDADMLAGLVRIGLVDIVSLKSEGLAMFESLVVGVAADTLDDGEAATVAYSAQESAVAVVDERKAIRLCSERFPNIRLVCTMDLIAHSEVQDQLGGHALADAVFGALIGARMRVMPQHISSVVDLIGFDRAIKCPSLPGKHRGHGAQNS
ncbi:hypothetical protein C7S18_09425 [Ahniella affigens]|uniref:PIN domain-containing protein n=1 Tax=Ahniella affigens TaxID=2021234 RepID=A0A2P1PRC4_9GAMM|nr:hypothetical protein [Ahniella affigens]AVP97400.1 hypothetical protein C7S18_09425 [Ahniella affigens]